MAHSRDRDRSRSRDEIENEEHNFLVEQGGNVFSEKKEDGSKRAKGEFSDATKIFIGAGGIYTAFIYYGSLQEDVFLYKAEDGRAFTYTWFLTVLETFANVLVGFVGLSVTGRTKGIPLMMFAISGCCQLGAKVSTNLALVNGLSFPVAILAKSAKMAPVMAGSLIIGGSRYSFRELLQVASIIVGTTLVSMGKKSDGKLSNTTLGVTYIILSLTLDGVTSGFQQRLKSKAEEIGVKPKSYDFMFWMNFFMFLGAIIPTFGLGEFSSGIEFCSSNPEVFSKIMKFSLCSAIGQSFIFYTLANFNPLVLSTVTTTRKIFTVLLSIFLKGHSLSMLGWSGIALACVGIISETASKF